MGSSKKHSFERSEDCSTNFLDGEEIAELVERTLKKDEHEKVPNPIAHERNAWVSYVCLHIIRGFEWQRRRNVRRDSPKLQKAQAKAKAKAQAQAKAKAKAKAKVVKDDDFLKVAKKQADNERAVEGEIVVWIFWKRTQRSVTVGVFFEAQSAARAPVVTVVAPRQVVRCFGAMSVFFVVCPHCIFGFESEGFEV